MKSFAAIATALLIGTAISAAAPKAAADAFLPRPISPPGFAYQWVPPVYQTVRQQIWIGEKIQTLPEWIEISPGYLQQVWHDVITPGHWEITSRQIQIADGHWQLIEISPPPVFITPPIVVIPPPFTPPVIIHPQPTFSSGTTVTVEGYAPGDSASPTPFSGLTAWPK